MRRRSALLFAVLAGAVAAGGGATADVNPVASRAWVTDAEVLDIAVAGDTAYLAGTFQRIGARSAAGDSVLDGISGAVLAGCARRTGAQGGLRPPVVRDGNGGLFMRIPYLPPPGVSGQLVDGDGVFTVPSGRSFVKVRPDCRFDRTFQLGEFIPGDPNNGGLTIASGGGLLYVGGARPTGPTTESYGRIAVFDATTGAPIGGRDFTQFGVVFVEGVAPDGRAVVVARIRGALGSNMQPALVDVASGVVTPMAPAGDILFSRQIGATLYVRAAIGGTLLAFDVGTGLPKAGWTNPSVVVSDIEAAGGRLFVATGASAGASVIALSEASGSVDPSWNAAPLALATSGAGVQRLALAGSRLYARGPAVRGVGGSERFQLFALDTATGAVDGMWAPSVFAPTDQEVDLVDFAGGVFVGALHSDQAITRRGLAAVSLAGGAVLPFDPNAAAQLTPLPALGVQRVAVNSTHVFTASHNTVRSVSRGTGAIEPWSVTAAAVGLASPNARVAALAATDSAVYVGGFFSQLSGAAPVPTQVRGHAGAFDAVTGSLLSWHPNVGGTTLIGNDSPVAALVVHGAQVVIAGGFAQVGGQTRHGLAVTDAATGALTSSLTLAAESRISDAVSLGGGVIYVGHQIVNGMAGSRIGLANPTTGGVTPWFTGFVGGIGDIRAGNRVAVFAGKAYSNLEWDVTTGTPNPASAGWGTVAAAAGGILNAVASGDTSAVSLHPEVVAATPGAPQNLIAAVAGTGVTLSWAPPAAGDALADGGAPTSYVIRAGSGTGLFNLASFDTGTLATSFATSAPNGTYYVRVHAKNVFGLGPASNEVSFTIGPQACTTPPAAPAGLVANVAGVAVSFAWNAASGASSYVLEAGSAAGLANLAVVNVGAATGFAVAAPPGTYFVRVRGSNACGNGPASNEVSIVLGTPIVVPGVPTGLAFTVDPARNVSITWAPPSSGGSPTGYVLEAGSAAGLADLAVAPVGGTALFVPGVPSGTYFVRVRAMNPAGQGPPTADLAIVVP
ncbi:MAG: hypothetical protein AB7U83_03805 [Vicinamibacterales bacterium]